MTTDVQTFEGTDLGTTVEVRLDGTATANLNIESQWFSVKDLKQLIKYLKALKKEIKQ